MRLDHKPPQAQQRRTTVFAHVKAFQRLLQGRLHQKGADFAAQGSHHTRFHLADQHCPHTFVQLENDITDERLCHNYVSGALGDVSRLYITNKINILCYERELLRLFE